MTLLLVAACARSQPPPATPPSPPRAIAQDAVANGEAHFEAKRWSEAAAAYARAHAGGATLDVPQRIRAALAHDRTGDREVAFVWIARALAIGPPARVLAARPELAELAADPRWQQAASAQAAPCSSAEHRGLDFWIGSWEVTNPAGDVVGTNEITSDLRGCRIHERWRSSFGGGESINWFDPADRRWHQVWIDDGGRIIHYTGGVDASGAMVLEGPSTVRDGTRFHSRMRLHAEGDRVRQVIEQSTDGGRTWKPWFDGTYRRAPP